MGDVLLNVFFEHELKIVQKLYMLLWHVHCPMNSFKKSEPKMTHNDKFSFYSKDANV